MTPEQEALLRQKTAETEAIFADIGWWMESKRRMIKHKSVRATRTCPKCGGKVHMILAGRKQHIHGACETPNYLWIME